eukprot:1160840-Pelagomonas_calceolata.AAC.3
MALVRAVHHACYVSLGFAMVVSWHEHKHLRLCILGAVFWVCFDPVASSVAFAPFKRECTLRLGATNIWHDGFSASLLAGLSLLVPCCVTCLAVSCALLCHSGPHLIVRYSYKLEQLRLHQICRRSLLRHNCTLQLQVGTATAAPDLQKDLAPA